MPAPALTPLARSAGAGELVAACVSGCGSALPEGGRRAGVRLSVRGPQGPRQGGRASARLAWGEPVGFPPQTAATRGQRRGEFPPLA